MATDEEFTKTVKTYYKKKRKLADLERERSEANSVAGQAIAAKQAEVTLAKGAAEDAAK